MAGWYSVNITVKFKWMKYKQKDVVEWPSLNKFKNLKIYNCTQIAILM